jgi:antitoxin component of MazEF toxin-antitoxin module
VKVRKIGGSLMVSIPEEIARRLELREGDDVALREDAGVMIVEPARSLAELLARCRVQLVQAYVERHEIDEAIRASDRDWAGEDPG